MREGATNTHCKKMALDRTKVALVTGSNKGIGLGIVRGLCKDYPGDVYLLSRDLGRGEAAVAKLKGEGLSPKLHQLDIRDQCSIDRLACFIRDNYGGIDVLVNNAGIKFRSAVPVKEAAEPTLKTNFWATLDVCKTLFPLLQDGARVVNVSSVAAQFTLKHISEELVRKFRDTSLTLKQLGDLMTDYVESAKVGNHGNKGWLTDNVYAVSKTGVNVMTFIHQCQVDPDGSRDIAVNCCCPGYVATDMTSYKGDMTIDQGAETPLYLALLPPGVDQPRGQFIKDKDILEW